MIYENNPIVKEIDKAWGTVVQRKDGTKAVRKLTKEQQDLLEELAKIDAPLYEIASALAISDARARYELNKVKDRL
jgi:hypothetical protein